MIEARFQPNISLWNFVIWLKRKTVTESSNANDDDLSEFTLVWTVAISIIIKKSQVTTSLLKKVREQTPADNYLTILFDFFLFPEKLGGRKCQW